jgi:outer membrane biosynthesis protein TonB
MNAPLYLAGITNAAELQAEVEQPDTAPDLPQPPEEPDPPPSIDPPQPDPQPVEIPLPDEQPDQRAPSRPDLPTTFSTGISMSSMASTIAASSTTTAAGCLAAL